MHNSLTDLVTKSFSKTIGWGKLSITSELFESFCFGWDYSAELSMGEIEFKILTMKMIQIV